MSKRTLLVLAAFALLLIFMSLAMRSRSTASGTRSDEPPAAPHEAPSGALGGPVATPTPRLVAGSAGHAATPVVPAAPPAKAEPTAAECEACRKKECTNYKGSGVNLVGGCFQAVDPSQGADTTDPKFLADCMAVVRCAARAHCAQGPAGAAGCYCGSTSMDDCVEHGPAADAPCLEEWRRATRSRDNHEISLRFSDLKYPSGWASAMIECDEVECKSKCSR